MTNWNENKPNPNDIPNATLSSFLTTQKIAIREGMERGLYWTQASGLSAGIPQLALASAGSNGPGAARAFFDVASNASAGLASVKPIDGRYYIASDTSRAYFFHSQLTVPIGSVDATVFSAYTGSNGTIQSNFRVLSQQGVLANQQATAGGGVTSLITIAFPTSYPLNGTTPLIQIVSTSPDTTKFNNPAIQSSSTTNFSFILTSGYGGTYSGVTVYWRSHGTVAL